MLRNAMPFVPLELAQALQGEPEASTFFDGLADGYKRRYCDWVGKAKHPDVRTSRARWALALLRNKQKTLKVGSYMGDVGIIKKIDDLPALKEELGLICEGKRHRDVSRYSMCLAEHILRLTDTPHDDALQACIDVNQRWQDGAAKFQDARDVADQMHQLARLEKDPVRVKILRVMGQVAATPHVKRHALIASDYAITLINLLHPEDMEAVHEERIAQIEMMRSV